MTDENKKIKTNELREIIKKSATEEIISSGTEKSGEDLLKFINRGIRLDEISVQSARIAKETSKALMQGGRLLGGIFKVNTLKDILSNKNESTLQKILVVVKFQVINCNG